MRPKLYGVLLALYVLAGRWGFDRILYGARFDNDYLTFDLDAVSLYELRFWVVTGLMVVLLLQPKSSASAPVKPGARNFALALNLYFLYTFVTALWAPDGRFAFQKSWELLLVVLASVCVHQVSVRPEGQEVRAAFWSCLTAMTGGMGVMALFKAATGGAERLAVLGGGPNVFGRMMGLLCIGSLYFWRRKGGPWFVASTVMAAVLVVLSGSRGGMISVAASVAAFFFFERLDARKVLVFTTGALAFGLAVTFGTSVGRNAIETYEVRVNQLMIKEGHTSGRTDIYKDAYALGLKYPVFGAGLAGFPGLGLGVYPHNFFLEEFCEGGVVGLALLGLLFVLFTKQVLLKRRDVDGATVAAFVLMLLTSQFSGDLYDSRAVFMFMMMGFMPRGKDG